MEIGQSRWIFNHIGSSIILGSILVNYLNEILNEGTLSIQEFLNGKIDHFY